MNKAATIRVRANLTIDLECVEAEIADIKGKGLFISMGPELSEAFSTRADLRLAISKL